MNENTGYVKLASEEVAPFNDMFIDQATSGSSEQVKEASVSLDSYIRTELLESSFTEKILTPLDLTNEDLDKSEDPEVQVKWLDREPDTAPAVNVPFSVVPDKYQFKGTRYPAYVSRIFSPMNEKDVDLLRGYDYDIRKVLMEKDVKNIATMIDTKFIETANSVIGSLDTANALNGLGLPQNVSVSGGLNRESLIEGIKTILRMNVPFGPLAPDSGETRGCMLANHVTASDLLKMGMDELGGPKSQDSFINGVAIPTVLGTKMITTIKRDLVPDGVVYLFSDESFLGRYIRTTPLTSYMKNEMFFLRWCQWMSVGIAIGNSRGVCRLQF